MATYQNDALTRQLKAWLAGVDIELDFWERWLATRGLEWPEDYVARLDPLTPIQPWLVEHAGLRDPAAAQVLDVGAGPVTFTGRHYHGSPVSVTPVDPLAPFYDEIVRRHGVSRPVPTLQAFAESLSTRFEPNTFDVTFCRNALDHSFDPICGIEEMLTVTRVGGIVILLHLRNEAEAERYEGLHQWNFDIVAGDFIVWNRESRTNVSSLLADAADVSAQPGDMPVCVHLRKRRDLSIDISRRHRMRLNALMPAVLSAFIEFSRERRAHIGSPGQ